MPSMNLSELQADLRHFAAEREWQPFHTPKNLSTALTVEAAELTEIFQWMTPAESLRAHHDPATKKRIGEEVADVLLYLLQVADHSQIDIPHAVRDKLARNALKHPAKQTIARVSPVRASVPGTHVLLDYENVQPTEDELRAMVPDASQVWVFHGPHQRQAEQRFSSFGANVTAVPISKTGKNALDVHLSFYMGYIASRNHASAIVVVANDKGYEPMLEHARALGFAVHQQGHGRTKPAVKKAVATKAPAKKAPVKKTAAKKTTTVPTAKKAPAKKVAPVKKVAAKPANVPTANKLAVVGSAGGAAVAVSPPSPVTVSADLIKKITDNLRKMGDKRPVKPASLRRALKSFLGAETGDQSIEVALDKLIAAGVVILGAKSDVSYPGFAP
jgi:NTP pyrophosphatase (non-canonical NTP hydrolase)